MDYCTVTGNSISLHVRTCTYSLIPWFQLRLVGINPGWQNLRVEEATTVLLKELVAERPGDSKITDLHPRLPCGTKRCKPVPRLKPLPLSDLLRFEDNATTKPSNKTPLQYASLRPVVNSVLPETVGSSISVPSRSCCKWWSLGIVLVKFDSKFGV